MGWLIAAAVLVLLLFLPLGIDAEYDRTLRLWLTVFGLRLRLYPKPKKSKKPEKPKPKPKPPATGKKKKKKPLPTSVKRHWRELLRLILQILRELRHKLYVRELTVLAYFGGADEAERALGYGRAWARIGVILPPLQHAFRIGKRDVRAQLDRTEPQVRIYALLRISLLLGEGLWIVIAALWRYWKIMKKDGKSV